MNGQYMRIRDKGPLFIVYPYDSSAELQNQIYYSPIGPASFKDDYRIRVGS